MWIDTCFRVGDAALVGGATGLPQDRGSEATEAGHKVSLKSIARGRRRRGISRVLDAVESWWCVVRYLFNLAVRLVRTSLICVHEGNGTGFHRLYFGLFFKGKLRTDLPR